MSTVLPSGPSENPPRKTGAEWQCSDFGRSQEDWNAFKRWYDNETLPSDKFDEDEWTENEVRRSLIAFDKAKIAGIESSSRDAAATALAPSPVSTPAAPDASAEADREGTLEQKFAWIMQGRPNEWMRDIDILESEGKITEDQAGEFRARAIERLSPEIRRLRQQFIDRLVAGGGGNGAGSCVDFRDQLESLGDRRSRFMTVVLSRWAGLDASFSAPLRHYLAQDLQGEEGQMDWDEVHRLRLPLLQAAAIDAVRTGDNYNAREAFSRLESAAVPAAQAFISALQAIIHDNRLNEGGATELENIVAASSAAASAAPPLPAAPAATVAPPSAPAPVVLSAAASVQSAWEEADELVYQDFKSADNADREQVLADAQMRGIINENTAQRCRDRLAQEAPAAQVVAPSVPTGLAAPSPAPAAPPVAASAQPVAAPVAPQPVVQPAPLAPAPQGASAQPAAAPAQPVAAPVAPQPAAQPQGASQQNNQPAQQTLVDIYVAELGRLPTEKARRKRLDQLLAAQSITVVLGNAIWSCVAAEHPIQPVTGGIIRGSARAVARVAGWPFRTMGAATRWYRGKRANFRSFGRRVDGIARGSTSAGVAGGVSAWATGSQLVQNILNVGGGVGSGVMSGICIALPAAPLLYHGISRTVEGAKHNREQERLLLDCEADTLHMNDAEQTANRTAFMSDLAKPTVEIIDDASEARLLEGLHEFMQGRLGQMPRLGSEENYAKYCFVRIVEACTVASNKAEAQRNEGEKELAKYAPSELIEADPQNQPSLKADALGQIEHVRQAAIAYGKLLAERERRENEVLVTGAIVGTSIGTFFTFGPLGPVAGAAALGARKLYRNHVDGRVHIEIDERNKVAGKNGMPVYNPIETRRRSGVASIFQRGNRIAEVERSPEKLKEWGDEEGVKSMLKLIVIPAASQDRCRKGHIRSARALAEETAPIVQSGLESRGVQKPGKKGAPAEIDELKEKLASAKEELKERRQARDKVRGDLRAAEIGIQESEDIIHQYENSTDYHEKKAKFEAERMLGLNRTRKRRAGAELPDLQTRVTEQEAIVTSLSADLRNAEHPKLGAKLTLEEIGNDPDIAKAFAVAVVRAFENNHQSGWMRRSAGATLRPAGSALQEVGVEVVAKPLAAGVGSGVGVFVAGKLVGLIAGVTIPGPILLVASGVLGSIALVATVRDAIKNFGWGKGKSKDKDKK